MLSILAELPGGGIEPSDTSIEDAARRELLEETGIAAKQIRLIGSFFPNNRRSASRCHVCVATDLEQRQATPEENEQIAFHWVALQTIDQAICAGTLNNGILLAAWSMYCAAQRIAERM